MSANEDNKRFYSTFRQPRALRSASLCLFQHSVPALLKSLYHPDANNPQGAALCAFSPEIKVGLAIKILYNTPAGTQYPSELLLPLLNDIEAMLRNRDYLESTGNARMRSKCLRREHELVQRYMDLDSTISLNGGEPTVGGTAVSTMGAVSLLPPPTAEMGMGMDIAIAGSQNSSSTGSGIEMGGKSDEGKEGKEGREKDRQKQDQHGQKGEGEKEGEACLLM